MMMGKRRGPPRKRQAPIFNIDSWTPRTKLGTMVKNKEITTMSQVFDSGMPILETEIVDALLPGLEIEVIVSRSVQRKTPEGQVNNRDMMVVVGNKNGYVGVGKGKAVESPVAMEKAITEAKLNIIEVRRGCGSWECACSVPHSLPFLTVGKCGSSRVRLMPAPRGLGLAAGDVGKKVLKMAGVKDVWMKSFGSTDTKVNFAKAVFDALRKTNTLKSADELQNVVRGETTR